MVGLIGERIVSLVVVVVVVVVVVAAEARAMESARAVESRLIESRRIRSMRAIESARAMESVFVVVTVVVVVVESRRIIDESVVGRVVGVVTSPFDSFVTRTRRCDVVVRRVESVTVRRVVSVCADAVLVIPTASATASAPVNEIRKFIHSSPHFRRSCQAPWAIGGRGVLIFESPAGFWIPWSPFGDAPSGIDGRCTAVVESIRRAAGSRMSGVATSVA
jgi:hypothetical protein